MRRGWHLICGCFTIRITGIAAFGEWNALYPPEYYEDILQIEEVPVLQDPPDRIVDIIKHCIDDGFYALVELNWSRDAAEPAYHEALFYGYDDDRQLLFTPQCRDTIGKKIYGPMNRYRHPTGSFGLFGRASRPPPVLQHPLSIPVLENQDARHLFSPAGPPIWRWKISSTRSGERKSIFRDFDAGQAVLSNNRFYRGLACLMGAKDKLDHLIETQEPDSFPTSTFVRLYEHRALLLPQPELYLQSVGGRGRGRRCIHSPIPPLL